MDDPLATHNRERWNALVAAGVMYSKPYLDLNPDRAREKVDEEGVMDPVAGKEVLCLGGGGGQQSAAFALLGARVTVLDLSDAQLDQDRLAAAQYGFELAIEQGDMRDLSRFDNDSFDMVWQPYSINFVPDVRPVFAEVRRVLRPGGQYRVMWHNPFFYALDDEQWHPEHGYPMKWPYQGGLIDEEAIFKTRGWTIEHEDGGQVEIEGPTMFNHTLGTFINNLISHGFVIQGLWEHLTWDENPEPGSWEHFKQIAPPYLTVWCRG